ncbi:MAG: hypothetical protein KG028_06180 [Actinobacteria bacterium]|jgi:hypothetical protein|nr:hypothetical protein [Actinomycetota bacterium]
MGIHDQTVGGTATRAVSSDTAKATTSSVAPPIAAVQQLQSTAGNAATAMLLQRDDTTDVKPAAPNSKAKVLPPDVAGQKLAEVRKHPKADGPLISQWVGYIVDKVLPPAGPVKGSYVSSFDTPKGGFSVSRTLPDVPDLVVHAHYQRDLAQPDTAVVNSSQVKWADQEEGSAPPGKTKLEKKNYPKVLGGDHDKIALKAWQSNPKRHEERGKVKGFDEKKWVKGGRKEAWEDDSGGDLGSMLGF